MVYRVVGWCQLPAQQVVRCWALLPSRKVEKAKDSAAKITTTGDGMERQRHLVTPHPTMMGATGNARGGLLEKVRFRAVLLTAVSVPASRARAPSWQVPILP